MNGNDAGDERGTGPRTSTDRDLSERLRRLEGKLDERRSAPAGPERHPELSSSERSAMGRAFRMSAEFVAGVAAGGVLGWLFDRGLGTNPWGLMVFLMLGFGAGIYNVMRASGFLRPAAGTDGRTDRK
jgi:ATP synthase protein I